MCITSNFETSTAPKLAINSLRYPANTINLFLMILSEECALKCPKHEQFDVKETGVFYDLFVAVKNLIAITCH